MPTMHIASSTSVLKWPFIRGSTKRGFTPTSNPIGTISSTSSFPKVKGQQTRMLHIAKGRKVSRKLTCDGQWYISCHHHGQHRACGRGGQGPHGAITENRKPIAFTTLNRCR